MLRRVTLILFPCLCLALWSFRAECAYRVYRLKITHYDDKGKLLRVQRMLSTLDNNQFLSFYGNYRLDEVELEDSWYCPGDTARHQVCPKPKIKQDRLPAAQPGSRGTIPYTRQPVIP